MRNVILSILTKISKMDAQVKDLTAQLEAQSLIVAAITLTIGKNGGHDEMLSSINKSINGVLENADNALRSDAKLLLTKFQEQVELTRAVSKESENTPIHINTDALSDPDREPG